MSDATLVAGALMSVASASAYGYVGLKLARTSGTPEDRMALRAFGLWWGGLALLSIVSALQNGLWLAGVREPSVYIAFTYLTIGPLCATVWGLFYYLAYLFSGSSRIRWWSAGFYGAVYVIFIALISLSDPSGVSAGAWDVSVEYAAEVPAFAALLVLVLLVLPVLGGAVAYGSLFLRVKEPLQRYRIAVVSLSLALWFAGPIGAQLMGIAQSEGWAIASRFIGLLAATAILLAYRPPANIARRLASKASTTGGAWDG